jgi:hypothetical protein
MNMKEFLEAEEVIIAANDVAKAVTYALRPGEGGGNRLSQAVTRDYLGTMRVNAIVASKKLKELVAAIERRDPSLR